MTICRYSIDSADVMVAQPAIGASGLEVTWSVGVGVHYIDFDSDNKESILEILRKVKVDRVTLT